MICVFVCAFLHVIIIIILSSIFVIQSFTLNYVIKNTRFRSVHWFSSVCQTSVIGIPNLGHPFCSPSVPHNACHTRGRGTMCSLNPETLIPQGQFTGGHPGGAPALGGGGCVGVACLISTTSTPRTQPPAAKRHLSYYSRLNSTFVWCLPAGFGRSSHCDGGLLISMSRELSRGRHKRHSPK